MAAKFKMGAKVKQILPAPLEGVVVKMNIVEDDLGYLVEMPDGSQRWFKEDQVEAVAE